MSRSPPSLFLSPILRLPSARPPPPTDGGTPHFLSSSLSYLTQKPLSPPAFYSPLRETAPNEQQASSLVSSYPHSPSTQERGLRSHREEEDTFSPASSDLHTFLCVSECVVRTYPPRPLSPTSPLAHKVFLKRGRRGREERLPSNLSMSPPPRAYVRALPLR